MAQTLKYAAKMAQDAICRKDIETARHTYSVGDKIRVALADVFGVPHIKRLQIVRFHPYLVELQGMRTITYGDLVNYMRSGERPIKMYDEYPQARRGRGKTA